MHPNDIHKMQDGNFERYNSFTDVLRVPGGWIFYHMTSFEGSPGELKCTTFVPDQNSPRKVEITNK